MCIRDRYIRTKRRRFWKTGDEKDKMTAYWVLYYALNTATLVMSPVIPFMTEHIWQNLTRKAVSYTHLDVYKRQTVVRILRKRQHLVFEGLDWLFFALTQKSTDKT